MSFNLKPTIEEWKGLQFSNNLYHEVQQKDRRLAGAARQETQTEQLKGYDIVGKTATRSRNVRNGPTPNMDMFHGRRYCLLDFREWGTMIDDVEKLITFHNPESAYSEEAGNAFVRDEDAIFYEALRGPVLEQDRYAASRGFVGTPVSVDYNDDQTLGCVDIDRTTGNIVGTGLVDFSLASLSNLRIKLVGAEAVGPLGLEKVLNIVVNEQQIQSLLYNEDRTANFDYNSVKALVNGQINSFMGFNFIRYEALLPSLKDHYFKNKGGIGIAGTSTVSSDPDAFLVAAGTAIENMCWISDGMVNANSKSVSFKGGEDPSHSFNTRLYAWMGLGAMRMDDKKVVKLLTRNPVI